MLEDCQCTYQDSDSIQRQHILLYSKYICNKHCEDAQSFNTPNHSTGIASIERRLFKTLFGNLGPLQSNLKLWMMTARSTNGA
mmetsp:Transcript_39802/g.67875  ORF Transcript_39802/g.67875 Transcript_39802/m.67875 type:complete len:83 (-) Transcript_39802:450-698(-)